MSTSTEILTPASRVSEKLASSQPITRRSDHDLQLARRIDWRFLLPEPYLRRVAYFGPANGALPAALKHFSESVQIISADDAGQFDLAVLRLREVADLTKAHALLVSGGYLYWEMKPLKWQAFFRGLIRSPRPWWAAAEATDDSPSTVPHKGAGLQQNVLKLFRDHVGELERLGFQDIQMHWQRPSFEACLEIIPMNEATALDYAFGRPRRDLASRLKFAAGKVMMQTGLLAPLTPCFSLIACKN